MRAVLTGSGWADLTLGGQLLVRGDLSPISSSNFLILPGFIRTPAQPASIAANTYLGWKWMSATTGMVDFAAIDPNASAPSCDGAETG